MVQNLIMEIPIVMKTKLIIPFFVLMVASTMSLMAQDTIDTNYYRYDNHFLLGNRPGFPNLATDEWVEGCPNGIGFTSLFQADLQYPLIDTTTGYMGHHVGGLYPYMYYKLSKDQDVYGIAIALDSVANFTNGDSLTVVLCDMADDQSRFIHLDSIIIKGGEIGKRRWIEIPIMRQDLDFSNLQTAAPYDDCIDTVLYRQVLEFYFDEPKRVTSARLWWKARLSTVSGSEFVFTQCTGSNMCMLGFYTEDCVAGAMINRWDYFFPLITALPEWEVPSLERVIPYPEGAVIPDPEDPEDPQDPDDPTDPEAIDGVYGNIPISIYPNPTDGVATISSPEAIKELSVSDLAGRVLLHQPSLGSTTTLDTAPLESGLYLLKVTTASGTATTKLAVR